MEKGKCLLRVNSKSGFSFIPKLPSNFQIYRVSAINPMINFASPPLVLRVFYRSDPPEGTDRHERMISLASGVEATGVPFTAIFGDEGPFNAHQTAAFPSINTVEVIAECKSHTIEIDIMVYYKYEFVTD